MPPPVACKECINDTGTGDACKFCHRDYQSNHHPVNFLPPVVDLINIDQEKFPLFEGKIQCFTCHMAEGDYIEGNSKLLRGGPYSDIRQLCFQCHYEEKYSDINVHQMQNEDGSFLVIDNKLVCTFCHPENVSILFTTETIKFKAE